MMGLLPVGDGQLTIYWSLPAAALAPDAAARSRGDAARRAAALWPEADTRSVAQANDFSRATYRNVALPRWNDGPILFIGDAAHGTSPQLGQGANLAPGRCLDPGRGRSPTAAIFAAAIARFAERRSATVRFYRQASHLLTPLFQSDVAAVRLAARCVHGDGRAGCPCSRPMATTTLAGLRTRLAVLGAARQPRAATCLDSAAQRPGVRPKRAEK